MPVAVVVDLSGSRKMEVRKKVRLYGEIGRLLGESHSRFRRECLVRPALTAGDSVEFLVNWWRPPTFFLHALKVSVPDVEFRVGVGAGEVHVLGESADECDGPAFWRAREALEDLKLIRGVGRESIADLKVDPSAGPSDVHLAGVISLTVGLLANMSERKLAYCYHHAWLGEKMSDIAREFGVTRGNVSKVLRGTDCRLLVRLAALGPVERLQSSARRTLRR
ncbi:MAG: SatD family protein [Candidatus Korarchaeota archaeon]|nr:SatD family protein [Candidatus Korarchaeota archaeon]